MSINSQSNQQKIARISQQIVGAASALNEAQILLQELSNEINLVTVKVEPPAQSSTV
jgi:hypothetical protein